MFSYCDTIPAYDRRMDRHPAISDVNKTKFLRPRPEQQDQDQSLQDQTRVTRPRPGFRTTALRTIHVLLIIKTDSFQ